MPLSQPGSAEKTIRKIDIAQVRDGKKRGCGSLEMQPWLSVQILATASEYFQMILLVMWD